MASSQEHRKHRKSSRYRAIAAELQKEIRLGTYSVGNLLPTETELMARYTASRQTIREALRIVIEQGLIVRRTGVHRHRDRPAGAVHAQRHAPPAARYADLGERFALRLCWSSLTVL